MGFRSRHIILLQIVAFFLISHLSSAQSTIWVGDGGKINNRKYMKDSEEMYQKGVNLFNANKVEKGLVYLKKAASKGLLQADLFLAKVYREGIKVKKDLKEAFSIYYQAHRHGHRIGSYNCGVFLENGWGVEKDFERAHFYYLAAARNKEFPEAQRALGSLYFGGRGVEKNYETAWFWYWKAADQGNPRALFNLGLMKEKGLGVEANPREAMEWYLKAAEKGEVKAFETLGRKYEFGEIVEKDLDAAIQWYGKGMEKGHRDCFFRAGLVFRNKDYSKHDNVAAIQYLSQAAQVGNVDAFCEIGLMYERGEGVEKDPATAAKWYEQVVERNYERGQFLLGLLYYDGIGVQKERSKGLELLKAAAKVKYPPAVKWLENNIGPDVKY